MDNKLLNPSDYGYVVKNNLCLFFKGPLSQWYGGFSGQSASFTVGSNFIVSTRDSKCDHELDKIYQPFTFNCCEQWMMANKATLFDDWESFLKIMEASSPQTQKQLGRQIKNFDADVWDCYKRGIVMRGNSYKFKKNPHLADFLKQFHRSTIFAEASPYDSIWGIKLAAHDPKALDIYQWEGENLLGEAIGRVRQTL